MSADEHRDMRMSTTLSEKFDVFVRLGPTYDGSSCSRTISIIDENIIELKCNDLDDSLQFDHVFGPRATQTQIYKRVFSYLSQSAIKGYVK